MIVEVPVTERPDLPHFDLYSNYDHEFEVGRGQVEKGNAVGVHYAVHFCAYVWATEGGFVEQVWRFNAPVTAYAGPDLPELIKHVCSIWGDE